MHADPSVLLLTGTVATGKTTIANEIGEILPGRARSVVVVDLDQLGWGYLPGAPVDRVLRLRIDNLEAIWPNLRAAGFRYVVISGAITTLDALERVRTAIAGSALTVVRLLTPTDLLERRLRARDAGRLLDEHRTFAQVGEHELDRARIEDARVVNGESAPREVAHAVLVHMGWT